MRSAGKRTARFLLAGACNSYVSCVNCVCYVLSCVRCVALSLWLTGTVRAEPETVISQAWVQSPDPAE